MIFLNGHLITSRKFPNGELNLLGIEEAILARKGYKMNHFILKYEDDRDLMALHFAKKQVDLRTSDVSILSISYMPYSRMDRAETPQTPFMLKMVAEFINSLNFKEVYVHEPHSKATGARLDNVVEVYDNIHLLKSVMEAEVFNKSVDYLIFPDKGAYERYNGKISEKNMLFGEKKRDFGTGLIQHLELEGDQSEIIYGESTAVIVDDLSSYGGTFIRVSEKLRELGFKRVVLLVCHAENSIFKGDLFKHVDKVYTTDSILTEQNHWDNMKYSGQLRVYGMVEQMREGYYK